MKAQNYKEIRTSYLIFLGYFTTLLLISIFCWSMSIYTKSSFTSLIQIKREELDLYKNRILFLNNRLDSINLFMSILNTKMVSNEDALERKILELKSESISEIKNFETSGTYIYSIYKKPLSDIEQMLETKKTLRQNKEDEELNKRKLQDCNNANTKLRNRK